MELKTICHGWHLQSGDQTMVPEDSAWQAMPHVREIGCRNTNILQITLYHMLYERH